jgi:uncharacterized protein with FMN-binding domain
MKARFPDTAASVPLAVATASVLFAVILAATVLTATSCGFALSDPGDFLAGIPVRLPDPASLGSGSYEGSYTVPVPAGSIAVARSWKVRVVIDDEGGTNRILTVEILEPESYPDKGFMPEMTERIVAANGGRPDVVSGASFSSTALLKAVEDALSN